MNGCGRTPHTYQKGVGPVTDTPHRILELAVHLSGGSRRVKEGRWVGEGRQTLGTQVVVFP